MQVMVASFPSNAVRLEGGEIRMGTDAANDDQVNIKEEVNHWIGSLWFEGSNCRGGGNLIPVKGGS